MGFCLGNAVKYIWRCGQKGDAIEDLKKARWYIDREIARLENAESKGESKMQEASLLITRPCNDCDGWYYHIEAGELSVTPNRVFKRRNQALEHANKTARQLQMEIVDMTEEAA
jgi:hypothetical protein